jgi:hypothetical protein
MGKLVAIDEALRRLRDGDYGICWECGERVPVERLEALPFADYCRDCQEDREIREPGRTNLRFSTSSVVLLPLDEPVDLEENDTRATGREPSFPTEEDSQGRRSPLKSVRGRHATDHRTQLQTVGLRSHVRACQVAKNSG